MAWEFDTAHSQVEFAVKHMMISTVRGHFKAFSGELDLNEQNPTASSVNVTIETASIDTGNDGRDGHLRSPDFFDVEHYPTATFKSARVEALGGERYRVYGDLTIHGVTRELPLELSVEGPVKDMQGNRRVAFSLTGELSRKDFGLNWNVALESGGWLVSDKVTLGIEAQVTEKVPATAEATAQAR
jgi:polyisoprenoid-binding protein YceI